MRISSSNIEMGSARSYSSFQETRTSTLVMIGTAGLLSAPKREEDASGNILVGEEARKKYDAENTFEEQKNALREKLNEMSSYSPVQRISHLQSNRDALSTVRDQCMQYLVSIFFGETEELELTDLLKDARANGNGSFAEVTETVYYRRQTYFEEREDTSFSTRGTVRTADGREISFGVQVEMSRSFASYYEENYTQIRTRMCDPLVINLDGNVAEMRDQTFYFDIDADGEKDHISMLGQGSGYLALDKNGDGTINDGSELFGSKSGDGFADLAAYDSDGNGWIDEADAVWKELLIWTKDEDGRDECYKLSEKGVGALCLSNASTDFSLNNASNEVNGRIRKTGIFLYENGVAGTLQHLDVAKKEAGFDAAG